jgi:aminoglycoside phosphotransferase (APT) family kinase protein
MAPDGPPAAAVREALADATGSDPGGVRLRPVPGGASRQTFLVEGAGGGRWVLRRDPPGAGSFVPLEMEFRVVQAAEAAGVPVPRLLRFEPEGGRFESAGYLMGHVEGESVAPRVLRRDEYVRARERLPAQLAQALARIHALDVEDAPDSAGIGAFLPHSGNKAPTEPANPGLAACDLWERELDEVGEPLPATEVGLRWLLRNAPPAPKRVTLVHGDFRLGNFIVDGEGLAAVIDWELCHLGDPAEDVAWLCVRSWRFGNDERPVAGLGGIEEFLDAYEEAGAARPEPERLHWWEAMGNVKWAVICARQAHDHLSGRRRSHELASLGRRICEPEWDLLEAIAS